MTIDIDNKLHNDIKEYCKLNGLVMKDFVTKLLKKAFTVEKYGEKPFGIIEPPKVKQTEVDGRFSDVQITTPLQVKKDVDTEIITTPNNTETPETKKTKKRKL